MTVPVRFHPLAENDLDSILRFIAGDSLANAAAFVDRVEQRCLSLGEMPSRGRLHSKASETVRELVFEHRIVIVYRVTAESVTILRIRYAGRNDLEIPDD